MKYKDMNYSAWSGTAEQLVTLLKTFGQDPMAVEEIQRGINGTYYPDTPRFAGWLTERARPAIEAEAKRSLMVDFHAKKGVFSPDYTEASLAEKFNQAQVRIRALEQQVAEQKQTIETLSKKNDNPSIH